MGAPWLVKEDANAVGDRQVRMMELWESVDSGVRRLGGSGDAGAMLAFHAGRNHLTGTVHDEEGVVQTDLKRRREEGVGLAEVQAEGAFDMVVDDSFAGFQAGSGSQACRAQ